MFSIQTHGLFRENRLIGFQNAEPMPGQLPEKKEALKSAPVDIPEKKIDETTWQALEKKADELSLKLKEGKRFPTGPSFPTKVDVYLAYKRAEEEYLQLCVDKAFSKFKETGKLNLVIGKEHTGLKDKAEKLRANFNDEEKQRLQTWELVSIARHLFEELQTKKSEVQPERVRRALQDARTSLNAEIRTYTKTHQTSDMKPYEAVGPTNDMIEESAALDAIEIGIDGKKVDLLDRLKIGGKAE